jgi:hypothetical protein
VVVLTEEPRSAVMLWGKINSDSSAFAIFVSHHRTNYINNMKWLTKITNG